MSYIVDACMMRAATADHAGVLFRYFQILHKSYARGDAKQRKYCVALLQDKIISNEALASIELDESPVSVWFVPIKLK